MNFLWCNRMLTIAERPLRRCSPTNRLIGSELMWSKRRSLGVCPIYENRLLTSGWNQIKIVNKNFFESLDYLLKEYFPAIYQDKRIEALGSIGKIILMIKFEKEVSSSKYLTQKEKAKILNYGKNFTKCKNKWSTSREREMICESGPVLMGKILYISSAKLQEEFWGKIFCRKNQIIFNREEYVTTLIEDIERIPIYTTLDLDEFYRKESS